MDLLEQASAWLEDQRTRHASRPVTYQRGRRSVAVAATVGRTVFELDDGTGAVLKVESRDYLILAADLVLDGQRVLPAKGDRISESQDGQTFVYEVVSVGDEPCWRYSDPYRKTLRVHSTQVETTP